MNGMGRMGRMKAESGKRKAESGKRKAESGKRKRGGRIWMPGKETGFCLRGALWNGEGVREVRQWFARIYSVERF